MRAQQSTNEDNSKHG